MNKKELNFLKSCFKAWLPLAITITFLCGLIFVAVQQNYRASADDPQTQLVEDISNNLANGQNPQYYVPAKKTDMAKSLAPYLLIYNNNQKLVASSVQLNSKDPIVPSGVLSNTKANGETKVTWQPAQGVRSAIVVVYYKGISSGYIAVGRSLREVEKREDNLQKIILLGFIATLVASFAAKYFILKSK